MIMTKKKILAAVVAVLVVLGAVGGLFITMKMQSESSVKLTTDEARELLLSDIKAMAMPDSLTSAVADSIEIEVTDVSYGDEKNVLLDCHVTTLDIYGTVKPYINEFLSSNVKKDNGMYKSVLNFKMEFETRLDELLSTAEKAENDITVEYFDVDGTLTLYADDSTVDALYGGSVKLCDEILAMNSYTVEENGENVTHELESGNVAKGLASCFELRYSKDKPDVSVPLVRAWNSLKADFKKNFIEHDRYLTILKGLWTTVRLTFCSLLIGIVIGFFVAFVRCTNDKLTRRSPLLKIGNFICNIYLTVIRGTPVVVQIMILYFVVFMPMNVDKFIAAVICFGLNSGAYVAEIVRGGIMSIDNGQTEAGRSLGFNYMQTMFNIIFPQAFKAVLPALANEFVVLLKETSIAFYIGLADLMYAGNAIRAATYSAFMPLVTVALIYLVMVMGLSKLVKILERKLRNNER